MERITDEVAYNQAIAKVDALMAKGSQNVSLSEMETIRTTAIAIQSFEQEKYKSDMLE